MIGPIDGSERRWKLGEWNVLLITAIVMGGFLCGSSVLAQDVDFVLTGHGTTEYEA